MLAVVLSAFVSSAVPSPGRAILDTASRAAALRLLVAQSPDPQEEKNLEDDMDRARRHLGHDDKTQVDEAPEPQADEPKKRERRKRHDSGPQAEYEGHGKAHYLVWGIVDWCIAGGLWSSSIAMGVLSGASFVGASRIDRDGLTASQRRSGLNEDQAVRTARTVGFITGVMALGFAGFGAWIATKASTNISIYGDLRNEESGMAIPTHHDGEQILFVY